MMQETLDLRRRVLPEDHPNIATIINLRTHYISITSHLPFSPSCAQDTADAVARRHSVLQLMGLVQRLKPFWRSRSIDKKRPSEEMLGWRAISAVLALAYMGNNLLRFLGVGDEHTLAYSDAA